MDPIEEFNLLSNVRRCITDFCRENNIALLYFFGSQRENGLKLLEGKNPGSPADPLTDLDVGVVSPMILRPSPKGTSYMPAFLTPWRNSVRLSGSTWFFCKKTIPCFNLKL